MRRPPYSEFLVLERSNLLLNNAREDETVLSRFGITDAYLDEFQSKKEYAESLPNWAGQQLEISGETTIKNTFIDKCVDWGKDFRTSIQVGYGKKSQQYKRFPSKSFNRGKYSESAMMSVMKNLIKLAKRYQSDLEDNGVDDAFITKGESLLVSLREANISQEDQKGESGETTQTRYGIFNDLIDDCNKIMSAGKRVYKDDPSKLSRYKLKWR